jgi:hypothetical protein
MFTFSENSFPADIFHRTMARLVAAIRLNNITYHHGRGFDLVIKRRNPFGRFISPVANLFFRLAHAPSAFWPHTHDWQHWEVRTFQRVNPQFRAACIGKNAIGEEQLPGETLWFHAQHGTLTLEMLEAAGASLARAHHLHSELHGDLWSHGDAPMCNVMSDPIANRARLIDFELVHNTALAATERQADDFCAFLLDLAAIAPRRLWIPGALAFLRQCRNPAVIATALRRLVPTKGTGRLWWLIRTNFAGTQRIRQRVDELRWAVAHGALRLPELAAAARPFRSCRPSTYSHAINPGTANASSRTRRIIAAASTALGGIPSSVPTSR